jgi:hypothetical protein
VTTNVDSGNVDNGPANAAPVETTDETTAGNSVDAGDVDPDSTHSADETGQGGDPTDPAKNKAHPWNG